MKILNAYAGLGGNRKNWKGVSVTAVESDPKIAAVYARLNPMDNIVVGDAHAFIFKNHSEFDFIWSSPPCQSHSKMVKASRHLPTSYADMSLYQEVIFLTHFFRGFWIVENVAPYYKPLIAPQRIIGRHCFWSNFGLSKIEDIERPTNFINKCNLQGKKEMMDWLGISFQETIYYKGNHCPAQVLRNCVHPLMGEQILEAVKKQWPEDLRVREFPCGG
jgi:DNA (cytosine-5)-methyltransferase 1